MKKPQKGDERPGMRPGKPFPMPTVRPDGPGMVRPPAMVKPGKPGKPGAKPYPMPQMKDDMGMKEQAKKRALEMMMGRKK